MGRVKPETTSSRGKKGEPVIASDFPINLNSSNGDFAAIDTNFLNQCLRSLKPGIL